MTFAAADPSRPIQQIDLFVDGKYWQTVTNIAPSAGNTLELALNGYRLSYTVPPNATLGTVVSNLAALVNIPTVTNDTRVIAFAHGDRLELQSLAQNGKGEPFYLPLSALPAGSQFCRVLYLPSQGRPFAPPRLRLSFSVQPAPSPGQLDATPLITYTTNYENGAQIIRVEAEPKPYVLQASVDQVQWTSVFTNTSAGKPQVSVNNSKGTAANVSTLLALNRSIFTESTAFGCRTYRISGPVQVGSWLQLTVTTTNSGTVWVSATNSSISGNISDLCQQLLSSINSAPALAGPEGVIAEDFTVDGFGNPAFNLRARSAGFAAADVRTSIMGGGNIVISPAGSVPLKGNSSDLRPRNHVYVTAGFTNLTASFSIRTADLADGYHELTAVAYEGSHVRTQSRATVPVQVRNSRLSADLVLVDLPATAPVSGTYTLRVTANTNNVTRTKLFSTGGLLATATNQPIANFTVTGTTLGVGQHPFYAVVETSAGLKYRTATRWARLQ